MTKVNTSNVSTDTDNKRSTITGKIFFAHVREPNTKGDYPSGKFQLDLSIDETTKGILESKGVQVKNKGDEKGHFVTLKSTFAPTITLPTGETVQGLDAPLIGNGSVGTVTVTLYANRESNAKKGNGGTHCLGMNSVKLDTLVPYTPKTVQTVDLKDL